MKFTFIIALALTAMVSLAVLNGCDSKDLEDQANKALDDAKDKMGDAISLDGLKEKFEGLGIAGIEAKAKEMGKMDLPAIKNLLTEKVNVENLMAGLKDMSGTDLMAKLKELAPKINGLEDLVKKAKTALGM